jgi:tRNA (guanine6-N2)-methyltransferase
MRAVGEPEVQHSIRTAFLCEVEVAEGLESIALDELKRRLGARIGMDPGQHSVTSVGRLRFAYAGDLAALLGLRTVHNAYLVYSFPAPRPRALLGDANLSVLRDGIETVTRLWPPGTFTTFRFSAAGAESAVMQRLCAVLAGSTGLPVTAEGDLEVRVRGTSSGVGGWEALIRLSPRPLGTRGWRVCNMPGAVHAPIAQAMVLLSRPQSDDVFLNLACGSGTLLLERRDAAPARRVIGCDTSPAARACAARNIAAGGVGGAIDVHAWDARAVPLPGQSIDALCCALPYGHRVGTHAQNVQLYPLLLQEAARVARCGARLVLLTQEVQLLAQAISQTAVWGVDQSIRVRQGGLYPLVMVLQRL